MKRQRIAELMDEPAVDHTAHVHALRSLIHVNRWLGVDRSLARRVQDVGGNGGASVLDLGTGGGGFLGYLAAGRESVPGKSLLIGLDRSPFAVACAQKWHPQALRGVVADARALPLNDNSVDIVTCSLFLHHFELWDAAAILREAARVARLGVVIGDLSRSWLAWIVTWAGTRVLSRSHLFHVDGPRSVRAAFRREELAELARQAGLRNTCVEQKFPFRLVMTWRKLANEGTQQL